jgi:hypothetical protein
MKTNPPLSFFTKPLNAWGRHPNRSFSQELWSAIQSLYEVLLYAFIPRVARPEQPNDPPDPTNENKAVDEGTLEQCKEIYGQVEAGHEYLDEKARSTFGVIAFLAPLLIAAVTYLLAHSSGSGFSRILSLSLGAIAFILLVLGFISTVRALAVQGREVLFLDTVIDPAIPTIRSYDRTRHAQGLLYCASVNAAFNAHISQCVRSAHVLTALAVITATLSAIPGFIALANQQEDSTKTEIISPISVKIDGAETINDSIKQIRDELKVSNSTLLQVNAINARLDKIEASRGDMGSASQ